MGPLVSLGLLVTLSLRSTPQLLAVERCLRSLLPLCPTFRALPTLPTLPGHSRIRRPLLHSLLQIHRAPLFLRVVLCVLGMLVRSSPRAALSGLSVLLRGLPCLPIFLSLMLSVNS